MMCKINSSFITVTKTRFKDLCAVNKKNGESENGYKKIAFSLTLPISTEEFKITGTLT